MKTEVKPNPTEGSTDKPEIFHAYTTALIVGAMSVPVSPPWLSLCKQEIKSELVYPLPANHIKCVVCLDLIDKPVD